MVATKLELPPPFDDSVREYERELMRFLLRATRDREESLDLFQETWLRAYRAYPQVTSANGLRPLLYRIATNLCRNWTRDRMRRGRVIADGAIDSTANAPARATARGSQDTSIDLRRTLRRLPAMQGRALVMRKFGGFDYSEIAEALGCSAEGARAHVYQALKKLSAARLE
ncbi:MAG: RNA polymerase sigma factor [Candidatus Binataceae bacterium]